MASHDAHANMSRFGMTLVCAIAGGWMAALSHVPLPWLLGPMAGVAGISMAGQVHRQPVLARKGAQIYFITGAEIALQRRRDVAMNTEIKHLMQEGSSLGQLASKPAKKPTSPRSKAVTAKSGAAQSASVKAATPKQGAVKKPVRAKQSTP